MKRPAGHGGGARPQAACGAQPQASTERVKTRAKPLPRSRDRAGYASDIDGFKSSF